MSAMTLNIRVWRQKDRNSPGSFANYILNNVLPEMSFLEMMDTLNEMLAKKGETPVAFDHDCREGICGSCGMMINGLAHGGVPRTATCQLHMRMFRSGDTITIEPWRAKAFPVLKDLVVDRSAFDRIIKAGGYVSVNVGNAPDANAIPIPKNDADAAFDAATCIACGACVAACKNASANLFTSAKISQLSLLPQGQVERAKRVQAMVAAMDAEGFGACTNEAECSAVCPKGIPFKSITRMNREYLRAQLSPAEAPSEEGGMGG